jgi:CRP-like cAMP-binding protein
MSTDIGPEQLRVCPLFRHVPEAELTSVAQRMRRRSYRRGTVIFHQGDPGDALHVIASGSVKIVLHSAAGDEAIIATLRPGDFFGELSLLDGRERSATASAIETTETLVLDRATLRVLLDEQPALRDALLTDLALELRRLTGHVEELHFLDLAGRLAAHLARLARDGEADSEGRITLDWPFTQSDLAGMIGGTRQSVNRLLSDLLDQDLVRLERDRLVIMDVDALERRADR